MQTIIIQPDVLQIHFVHEQEPEKNKFIQVPSNVLEKILYDWAKSQPAVASAELT